MSQASIAADGGRRERVIAMTATAAVVAVAWLYLVLQARGMAAGVPAAAMPMRSLSTSELFLLFVMWAIMMVGMMLPSAVPLILSFMAESHREQAKPGVLGPTAALVLGYVAVWTGFSIAATLGQWALREAALLSPMMVSTSPVLSGALLIAAGLYQLTPPQYNLLKRCRQPLHFLRLGWREGTGGAFVMGLEHGAYCLGCCLVLMGVLFVGGVMNLLLLIVVSFFVLLEKCLPFGNVAGIVSGPLMIAAGLAYVVVK